MSVSKLEGPGGSFGWTQRIIADVTAAATSGFAVTPIIAAVDRALAENASGKAKLWPSFFQSFREMGKAPVKFVKSPQFLWIWLVYGSTYLAANVVDTVCKGKNMDSALPKWIATSTTNTSTCIAKDRAFAKLFGATTTSGPVPLGSYGAWLGRDLLSMAVFFSLPPIVGKEIAKVTGNERSGYYAAQIGLPLAVQTITTPVHLLGYEIYNNPKGTVADRITFMKKDYWKNVSIRMVRMAPPWSLGTIGNKEIKQGLLDMLLFREQEE